MPEKTLRALELELQRLKNRRRWYADTFAGLPDYPAVLFDKFDKRIAEVEAMITAEKL